MAVAPRSGESVRSDCLDNMIHIRWIDLKMSKRKGLPVVIRATGAGRTFVFLPPKKCLRSEIMHGNISERLTGPRFPWEDKGAARITLSDFTEEGIESEMARPGRSR